MQRLEASFDEILMSNRLTLEGLRGIFMFLVIYDHYHNPRIKISPQFQVDVFLFMVLSGLTTSFQLRETPVFEKRPQHIEGQRPYVLKARSDFKIIPFMVTRMVGLYPILWLALLLHIPLQLKSDKYNSTNPSVKKVAECQVLYIFALQSWLRPQCRVYGPNYVLYASIIFVVCIYYAILRKGLVLIQNYVMQWSSTEYDPVTLKAHVGLDEGNLSGYYI